MFQRLIIISNRLPFKIEKKGNDYEIKQSSGGLISALQSLPGVCDKISWIGIADFKPGVWNEAKDSLQDLSYEIEPLFVDKKKYELYYEGFSNEVIWPLFHYFPTYAIYDEPSYDAYKNVNKIFADKVRSIAKPGDLIWVHDYHLMLLPKLIKDTCPWASVAFFLHIPFPSYEILKLLPGDWRTDILNGLIAADVVGFQTSEYLSHFKRSLAYFSAVTCNNGRIQERDYSCFLKSYPISIDFRKFNEAYDLAAVKKGRNNIRQRFKAQKIMFSVDRLDYTKGVMNRLQAFESLLENHPEYREKVVFVINIVPSRDQIRKYAERKKMIEENIGRINGLYGNMNWNPVIYQYRHLTFNQLLSFYTVADIALVTPLRDGMNLVAKEFVASRKDLKGVLILSEFAGAVHELTEALMVNPNDIHTMKDGILKALSLSPEEQSTRMRKMQKTIEQNDISKWTNTILKDIRKSNALKHPAPPHVMTQEEKNALFDAYLTAKKRLILLDYDGTLVSFYTSPQDAVPGQALKEVLARLSSDKKNEIVIISGRDANTLDKWFSGMPISLVAEHGAMFKKHGSEWVGMINSSHDWKEEVEQLMKKYLPQYKGAFIEKKDFSVALHYRRVPPAVVNELKSAISRDLMMLDANNEFNVLHGNMVVEVKSPGVDKGVLTTRIVEEGAHQFVLAIGDDRTDEDMFSVLNAAEHYTVKVGIVTTNAKCNLINVENVIALLDQLSNLNSTVLSKQGR